MELKKGNVLDTMKEEYGQLAELVMRLQHNPKDESAFAQLYEKTYQHVLFTARKLVNDEETAVDITQEVYITLFRNIQQIEKPQAIVKWLLMVVKSKAKDVRMKASVQKEELVSEEQDFVFANEQEHHTAFLPHAQLDDMATRQIIGQILQELPEEQSQTLIYRFVEGLQLQEIAELMGCTVSTVKSRIKYGKQKVEVQVTDLEKKGIKLYSFSLPMFIGCLRAMLFEKGSLPAADMSALLERIEHALGLTAAAAGAAQAAGAQSAAQAAGTSQAASAAAGTSQGASAAAGTSQGASAAAGTAAAKAGSSVAVKVIAGVLAAAAIGGGVYAVPKLLDNTAQAPAQVEQAEQAEQEDTRTPEQIALQEEHDQAAAYLDVIDGLLEEYGERRQIATNSSTGEQIYSGLITARLIDFDADGVDELFCVYSPVVTNQYGNAVFCWVAIYGWDGSQAYRLTEQRVGLSELGNNSGDIFGNLVIYLVQSEDDPKTYLYMDEMFDLIYTESKMFAVTDGTCQMVFDYQIKSALEPDDLTYGVYDAVTGTDLDYLEANEYCGNLRAMGERIQLNGFSEYTPILESPDTVVAALEAQAAQAEAELGDVFQPYEVHKTPEQLLREAEAELQEAEERAQLFTDTANDLGAYTMAVRQATGGQLSKWETVVSHMVDRLEQVMSEEDFEQLQAMQQEWESGISGQQEQAGATAEGGTMQPILMYETGADIYKERAYQLYDALQELVQPQDD